MNKENKVLRKNPQMNPLSIYRNIETDEKGRVKK